MKIKLLVLLAGTFLGVAYLVGCGGGGNNGGGVTCPAGQTYINGTCQVGVGANGYAACQTLVGTPQYQACIAQQGCTGGYTGGYAGGYPGYGGYNNGYPGGGVAAYPNQNCGGQSGFGPPGYYGGGYSPYPPQGGYYYQPYYPVQWGIGINFH